jgi:type IV pilus assembly protein PilM
MKKKSFYAILLLQSTKKSKNKMSLLWENNQAIGLDISDLSLKIVQLEKIGDKIKIQAVGRTNLQPGIIEEGEIKNREELIKSIRGLLSRPGYGKISTNEAVVCLPEIKTFLKIIEVDKNTVNFAEAVLEEAKKHIPLSTEDAYFDWQIIKESIKTKTVLLSAVPKILADQYADIIKESKLIATALENESLSICRCLLPEENTKSKNENLKNYMIMDIGATSSSLTVYAKKTILFSVSIPVSGEKITKKIAEELDIEKCRAEKAKIIYSLQGGNEQPIIKEIIAEMVNDLISKSREALAFFNNHFSSWGPIDQIILCGGGANIKGIEKTISKNLEIETIRGDALINLDGKREQYLKAFQETLSLYIDFDETGYQTNRRTVKEDKTLKISQETALSYATAIGLALRGVLIQKE